MPLQGDYSEALLASSPQLLDWEQTEHHV